MLRSPYVPGYLSPEYGDTGGGFFFRVGPPDSSIESWDLGVTERGPIVAGPFDTTRGEVADTSSSTLPVGVYTATGAAPAASEPTQAAKSLLPIVLIALAVLALVKS